MNPKDLDRTTGKLGERLGEEYLRKQGYRILGRNVRSPLGEIDLVALDEDTLVFVEVKTRRDTNFGSPEESVGNVKRERLVRLAAWYLAEHPGWRSPVRFDVLAIRMRAGEPAFHLIQNAIEL